MDIDVSGKLISGHLGGHSGKTNVDEGALDYLIERYGSRSMIDVGCGPGAMVEMALKKGIEAFGIEGDPEIKNAYIIEHDYTLGPFVAYADLAWCVEFLEHVEAKFQDNIFSTLKGCMVVFVTHALPGKKGDHHVNCQTEEYWIEAFKANHFGLDPVATEHVRKASTMKRKFTRRTGKVFVR